MAEKNCTLASSPGSSGTTSTWATGTGTVLDPMSRAATSIAIVVAAQLHYLNKCKRNIYWTARPKKLVLNHGQVLVIYQIQVCVCVLAIKIRIKLYVRKKRDLLSTETHPKNGCLFCHAKVHCCSIYSYKKKKTPEKNCLTHTYTMITPHYWGATVVR